MGMSFADPTWLYALPPVLAGITILYFLKLKRREMVVSSTYLWQQAISDLRVNSPFQRLRMNLLLFLQLLIAALVIFTLARPRSSVGSLEGRDVVLLVDRSASMAATDGGSGKTRFERAKAEARRLIEDMTPDDRAILIAFDDRPEIFEGLTNQKSMLTSSLDRIKLRHRITRLDEALELAFKLSSGESRDREREVFLFSDGICKELGRVLTQKEAEQGVTVIKEGDLKTRMPENASLKFVKVGDDATANYGITSIDLRRTLDREALLQLFIGLLNDSPESRTVGVDVTCDGELVESEEVVLPANGVTSLVIDSESLRAGRLEVSLDAKDSYALDNKGYAIAEPKQALAVLLVSPGNAFLERAIQTMSFAALKVVEPGDFNAADPGLGTYDCVIFDRYQPELMPPCGCLFFNEAPPYTDLAWNDVVRMPRVVDANRTHPVAAYVNFGNLEPAEMRPLVLRKGDEQLVEAEGGPMISIVRGDGRPSIVVGFDTLRSRWPFQAGFPIFLANAIRWLGGEGTRNRQLRSGEPAVIDSGEGEGELRVTLPDGEVETLPIEVGRRLVQFNNTNLVGFYKLEVLRGGQVTKTRDFAVNISDPLESRIHPRGEFKLRGQAKPVTGEARAEESNREIWRLFAWATLAFLVLEWWIYNRKVFV